MTRKGSDLRRQMSDLAAAINAASNDYVCRMGPSSHWLVLEGNGGNKRIWSFPGTPSSTKAAANYVSEARRRGFVEKQAMRPKIKFPTPQSIEIYDRMQKVLKMHRPSELVERGVELGKKRGMRVWASPDSGYMSIVNFKKTKTASAWVLELFDLATRSLLGDELPSPKPAWALSEPVPIPSAIVPSTDEPVAPEPVAEPVPVSEPVPVPVPVIAREQLVVDVKDLWVPTLAFEALAHMKWSVDYELKDCLDIAQRIARLEALERYLRGKDERGDEGEGTESD